MKNQIVIANIDETIGASFFNMYITTTVSQLESIFGKSDGESGDGKSYYNWHLKLKVEDECVDIPFTIYDWNEGIFSKDTKIDFHIGISYKDVKLYKNDLIECLRSLGLNAFE